MLIKLMLADQRFEIYTDDMRIFSHFSSIWTVLTVYHTPEVNVASAGLFVAPAL